MAVQVGRLPEKRGRDERPPGVLLSRARSFGLPDRFIGMLSSHWLRLLGAHRVFR